MRSLAQQNVSELGGSGSVLSRQKRDHIRLDQLLRRLALSGGREQDLVLLDIYRLVFPHAYAEETVLWPAIRRVLPDGQELTLRIEREHQEINELATQLETLEHASDQRSEVLGRLVELLQEDVRDEEDMLLPRLQAKLTAAQLRRLGVAWEAVRLVSPTRPHAIVSRRPPGNVLAALPLAILDRCRDALDRRFLVASRPAPGVRAVSSALKRASHAVEHIPGMKQGEDPSTRIASQSGRGWGTAAIGALIIASAAVALARRRGRARGVQ
jgi:hemerythrin superfamily protein